MPEELKELKVAWCCPVKDGVLQTELCDCECHKQWTKEK